MLLGLYWSHVCWNTLHGCGPDVCVCVCVCPQQQLAQLQKEKSEILKNLALYYFTFVDVMEFKVWLHLPPGRKHCS